MHSKPSAVDAGATLNISKLRTACSACNLREICLPVGLTRDQIDTLDQLVYTRRNFKRGSTLYNAGDNFSALYAIRSGCFKTSVIHEDGRDQITGFQMAGEVLGMDGIGADRHGCNAIALEDSEVCVIPFARLEEIAREVPPLQHHFHRVMSREIVREHGVMMMLGSMSAEERLAGFLLNLSQRLATRGYSGSEFNLRMSREEIGSYLGLTLETVSRMMSSFQGQGLLTVRKKEIRLLDPPGLRRIIGQNC